ncbi:MAG: XdhC family protein [Myxococcota bacterium]
MNEVTLTQLLQHLDAKRPVVLVTNLDTNEQRLLGRGEGASDAEQEQVLLALSEDRCAVVEEPGASPLFFQPFNPPLRLVIVGAVHIAQALSTMATVAGYEVTVVDPRQAFTESERFSGVSTDTRWPDEALADLGLDSRVAVVTLTHDPKLDDPALEVALRSDAFFIGSLGSRKTHAARTHRLTKAGFTEAEVSRIRGPVGLAIGSRTPEEIAVSILAQIVETLRVASG